MPNTIANKPLPLSSNPAVTELAQLSVWFKLKSHMKEFIGQLTLNYDFSIEWAFDNLERRYALKLLIDRPTRETVGTIEKLYRSFMAGCGEMEYTTTKFRGKLR